jgi:CDP-diacylglycerol--glycerol-3-phosphate 3-phosphatidyltransferase
VLNNDAARRAIAGIVEPPARLLLRIGVTPDMVTVVGALGSSLTALILVPRGEFLLAVAILALLTVSDLLDGTMARIRGTAGPWGNFLDSTLDRVTDAALFSALLWWAVLNDDQISAWAAAVCVAAGVAISYSKARAESLGATADGGIMERAERLIVAAVAGLLTGFGVDWAMPVLLSLLAVLSVVTVLQRFATVRRQLVPAPQTGQGESGQDGQT